MSSSTDLNLQLRFLPASTFCIAFNVFLFSAFKANLNGKACLRTIVLAKILIAVDVVSPSSLHNLSSYSLRLFSIRILRLTVDVDIKSLLSLHIVMCLLYVVNKYTFY